jgi:hypothetical protein
MTKNNEEMTDKQIIIDGVDVTQCGFFSKVEGKQTNVCYIMPCHELETEKFMGYLGCSTNHNCHYKQLKRKEQECKELKEYKEDLTQRLCDMNAHKTFEIVELKQTLAEIKEIAERGLNCSQCSCGAKADLDLILQKINKVEDDLV